MNYLKNNWRKIAAGLILCTVALVLVINNEAGKTEKSAADSDQEITLTILGNVASPGSYKIKKGTGINDNLLVFGGFTEDADVSNIDLNAPLYEDTKITVKKRTSKENKNSDEYNRFYELPK